MKKLDEIKEGVDIGHGVDTPNKDFGDFNEHEFNSNVAILYQEFMKNKYGFHSSQFVLAQEPHSKEVKLHKRYNDYDGLDFYISFHADWNSNPNVDGVTIYHWKGSTKGKLLAETFAKHYKDADMPIRFRAIDESDTDPSDGTWDNHGILREPYSPGIIIEHGFMSNKKDLINMSKEHVQLKFAEIWADASIDFLVTSKIMEPLKKSVKIDPIFDYVIINDEQKERVLNVRVSASQMLSNMLENCPESKERQQAIQRLEECLMWATKSISRE